ncbi:MAG: aminomethyl-transferring glycine dehydrogenase subunit GcvPB [Candidatus Omnitrophica bacterium]|nr:aminomethyl-transferring glycine dehydrogenase subunit GcvPB [Candidatus Omnitrophota bacterium]
MISQDSRLSFEKSKPGRQGVKLPRARCFKKDVLSRLPEGLKRKRPLVFPEMTEPEVMRHFVNMSRKNFSVDTHFYPLGSCTMKYNPKVNEWASGLESFTQVHPWQPEGTVQGILRILYELEQDLCEITGMDRFTLQPAAGAHGELTGMMLVHAYHQSKGEVLRRKVLVPDSSHGTNPASAALLGFRIEELKSDKRGRVSLEALDEALDQETACLMLTNPNTLGLFEADILEITKRVHAKGALLYYDGANLNPLLGLVRPGDMGFDIVHLNLHKTFSTPHGGGGPGAGPVGVKKYLTPFLPVPMIEKKGDGYYFENDLKQSIGKVKSYFGHVGVMIRAYVYIRSLGLSGLKQVSADSILSANYLKEKLKDRFSVAVDEPCMHEFVLSAKPFLRQGIHAGDIGKRLLDYGFHAPTVHFPLVVEEALMIEPTESETRETLDQFVDAMTRIADEIQKDPEKVKTAPHTMPIRRPDEVMAARKPILSYRDQLRERMLAAEGAPAV